eukprot:CAMPEP_0114510986 /NCGR_PEP_ID=MMETSP0109-20121206/14105_1 /TAXON_ID=29199 /ORGANISM="Chlorarachnion reptans, Strain CCCM449" /LENGTH=380 /DNA_ID=CAMNT_0001690381 /DNA_START=418 /DNA_END=1560 /DNA_ORIENTATION=+
MNLGWMTYNCGQATPLKIEKFRQLNRDGTYDEVEADKVRIVHIDVGAEFCAAISQDGRVFTWGSGIRGQLGHGPDIIKSNLAVPTEVTLKGRKRRHKKKAKGVACGFQYLMILDEDGDIWACGKGSTGCLGMGFLQTASDRRHFYPANIRDSNVAHMMSSTLKDSPFEFMPAVAQVSAGMNHTLFLAEDFSLWACGRNNNLELGLPDFKDRWVPSRIDIRTIVNKFAKNDNQKMKEDEHIVSISAGNVHSAALLNTGRVLTWGMNRHGQCGVGHEKAILNRSSHLYENLAKTAFATPPSILPLENWPASETSKIVAGFYDTFLISKEGDVLRVGMGMRNPQDYNQFTNSNPENIDQEASGHKIEQVSIGWKHVLAVVKEQ